jgi:hypothetical protein
MLAIKLCLFALVVVVLVGIARVQTACDEPEKHAPRNRAFGKRNHDTNPLTQVLGFGPGPGQTPQIQNLFTGVATGSSFPPNSPDYFQIPVSVIRDASATSNNLCPTDGTRYDKGTKQCFYPLAATNPCNEGMDFVGDLDNSVYGHCECTASGTQHTHK